MLRALNGISIRGIAGMLCAGALCAASSNAHADGGPPEDYPREVMPEPVVRPAFEIYGFAMGDFIYDTKRVDPDWRGAFRPSKIATFDGEFGEDGQTTLSARQSRFGVTGEMPTGHPFGPVKATFEFDLFGVGADAGETTFRLRKAYGEWGPLLAGQTNSLFMDGDVFPNVIDYWGPPGMVFFRNVQIRLTPYRSKHMKFAFAVEQPTEDIDPGRLREIAPAFAENVRPAEPYPDLTFQWRVENDWGHVQIAALFRGVSFETLNTVNNEPNNTLFGWGVNLGTKLRVFERDNLIGQVIYGEGVGSYLNDGGTNLAPDGPVDDLTAQTIPVLGVVAYYDHYWNDVLSSSFGYSFTQLETTSFQEPFAFRKGEYASVNLLYTPVPSVLVGIELLWGQRTNKDRQSGEDIRLQFSAKYSFGIKL